MSAANKRGAINRTHLIAERDGWICNGCGETCVPYTDSIPNGERYATVDHKDPTGGNELGNLWLMCAPCNSSKGQQSLEDWERTLDFDGGYMRRGFTQIPNGLLYAAHVSLGARMTLICLMQFAWKGDPFPGQEKLGTMLGVTDRTIREYLSELKDKGYIKVYRRGRGKTNVYRIVQQKLLVQPSEETSVQFYGERKESSGLDRKQASDKEYEVEEDEVEHLAAAPRQPRPANDIWDVLSEIFGEPTTRTAQKVRGKVASSLRSAGANRDEILKRAKTWPQHFDNATFTDLALEKHWDTLGRKPLRRQ